MDLAFEEKFKSALLENAILDLAPLNKIPIISDAFEAVLSLFGIGYFSSDKMSSTWLTQAVSAVNAWKDVLGEEETSTTTYNAIYKTTRALSSAVGISFSGAMREAVALWNNTAGATDTTKKIRQYELTNTELGNELYEAIMAGDKAQANSLKDQFEDKASLNSAIRKALKENDPRIEQAAKAQINGDPSERVRISKQIIADGFAQDDVVVAVNSKINELDKDDDAEKTEKVKGFYTAEDFVTELINGDQANADAAKQDVIKTKVANGSTEEDAEASFESSVRDITRDKYTEGDLSREKAIDILTTYCDADEEEAELQMQICDWKKDNPQYEDLELSTVTAYIKPIEDFGGMSLKDVGMDVDAFVDYRNRRSDCKGVDEDDDGKADNGTVKAEVMELINSLPLTADQKDALYFLNGWSEKTLRDAPWH